MTRTRPVFSVARFWTDRPLAFKGLVVVALPLLAMLCALFLLYLASTAETRAEEDVRRAFAIQRDTYQVHALLAEAAAGARGYALTGQERFLEPYRKAEAELPQTMARLDSVIRDPEVRQLFEDLRILTARKRDGLVLIVKLGDGKGDPAALRNALVANKQVLDMMREKIGSIQHREKVLLAQRQGRVDQQRSRFLLLTTISAIVGLLGSFVAVFLFSTGIVRRVRALEGNAERLAQGEPLVAMPDDADEIGRLAMRLSRSSDLLRAREQELRESEERFRLVVEKVREYGIFALSPEGIVTSWNLGAERIKGWRADEILGRHFSSFYPEDTIDTLPLQMLDRARTEGTAEDEGWRVRKDGSRFWANVVITALRDTDGQLRGFAKVTRDMSERRLAEEALRLAREEAVAANLAKSEFLSRTSHELRTPLNAILGFGQLLEIDEDTLSERHRAGVQQITKAGRHLLSLINDLLDISSIEAGGADLDISELDMSSVLHEAHDLALPIVTAAGLEFRLEQAEGALFAMSDRRRIIQVILNLVANAAKYNSTGRFVALTCEADGEAIRITVSDDGPGIAPSDVPRLFRAFDRLGQPNRTKIEGTGLGLALCKSLVESLGGVIAFSPASPGAKFWFTMPAANAKGSATISTSMHQKKEGGIDSLAS